MKQNIKICSLALKHCTRLTIGGYNQPGVARNLIDMPADSEKGLSHRFIWIFSKPLFGKLTTLEEVQKKFSDDLGLQIFSHSYAFSAAGQETQSIVQIIRLLTV